MSVVRKALGAVAELPSKYVCVCVFFHRSIVLLISIVDNRHLILGELYHNNITSWLVDAKSSDAIEPRDTIVSFTIALTIHNVSHLFFFV
jgi:hypothetical protein